MIKKKTSKKAMAFAEFALIVISFVMIGVFLFMTNSSVTQSKQELESITPKVNYDFPAVFIHSFLMYELEEEDIKKISIKNPDTQIKFVKDLVWLDSEDSYKMLLDYREKYIDYINSQENMMTYYNSFAEENLRSEDLLEIKQELAFSELPNLNLLLENKNYAFYMKTKTQTYTAIYFKGEY